MRPPGPFAPSSAEARDGLDEDLGEWGDLVHWRSQDGERADRLVTTIGSLGAASVQARLDAVTLADAWTSRLAAHAQRIYGPAALDTELRSWADGIAQDARMAGVVYETALRSWMAGQLVVRTVELEPGEDGSTTLRARRDDEAPFLSLPFEDAIAFFEAKDIITPAEFAALRDRFRAGGFTAVKLASDELLLRAKQAIASALEGGLTIDEASRAIRDGAITLGIEPGSSGYLETVVRTNVASAYGAGKFAAQRDPVVVALRPYVQYLTAGDTRVRERHALLNLLVFENGSELADYYHPPLGYCCRCTTTTLSARQFGDRGLALTTTRVSDAGPDPGWDVMPLAA